ncbi:hypothetical protein J437_LFUL017549 [Ladona fulva]|uniref:Uncharacterized protein n=1 Tax=Ladona fulva TaxID=123851 RepID=A0A8K0PA29_LADFU|nr:hypothetical protein J437_LFUL017549 [Ladona fulva]
MVFSRPVLVFSFALFCHALAQYNQQYTTPVPILKQINRHNDDGSYSYGYEGADGTFRIETKHPTGEVYGKYGFVDDVGTQRVVEYGATRRGFEPTGTGITVAPPTIHSGSENNLDYDDGQYREDPRMYYKEESDSRPSSGSSRFNTGFSSSSRQQYQQPQYQSQQYQQPQQQYQPQQFSNRQYYQPQEERNAPRAPVSVDPTLFRGHPASNFDVNTGSYVIKYSG